MSSSPGQIVMGGQDTVINVFALGSKDTENPESSLLGHTGNVCALSTTRAGNTILSGSWDWQVLFSIFFRHDLVRMVPVQDSQSVEEFPAGLRLDWTQTVSLGGLCSGC